MRLEPEAAHQTFQRLRIVGERRVRSPADVQVKRAAPGEQVPQGEDELVDPLAGRQVTQDAELSAEGAFADSVAVERDRFGDDGDFTGLGREAMAEFPPLGLADQNHAVDGIPLDRIGPPVELITVQTRHEGGLPRQMGSLRQALAGPLEEDHVVRRQEAAQILVGQVAIVTLPEDGQRR
jgi:hypothetical protein